MLFHLLICFLSLQEVKAQAAADGGSSALIVIIILAVLVLSLILGLYIQNKKFKEQQTKQLYEKQAPSAIVSKPRGVERSTQYEMKNQDIETGRFNIHTQEDNSGFKSPTNQIESLD